MTGPSYTLPDYPAYDATKHLAYVQELYAKHPYRETDVCLAKIADLTADIPPTLRRPVQVLFAEILEEDDIFVRSVPTLSSPLYLSYMQKRLTMRSEAAFAALREFIAPIISLLPTTDAALSLTVADFIPADAFIAHCFQLHVAKSDGEHLFPSLRRQLSENLITSSGYNVETYDEKRPLVEPKDSKYSSVEKLIRYLGRTPFLELLNTSVPFDIPFASWKEHGFIFAKSGHGKTQTLRSITASLLHKDCALFLLDGNGALIKDLERIESIQDRLVVVDPDETPQLNFFRMQVQPEQQLELYFYLFTALDQSLTPRMATMVSYLVDLMLHIPGSNLDTLRKLCQERTFPYADALPKLSDAAQDYFNHSFTGKDQFVAQTKASLADRLHRLSSYPKFLAMMNAPTNDFNALQCMQEKKIVIVDASRRKLGDDGSAIFGRYILAQCLAAAWQRSDADHLALVIVDEAKTYLDQHSKKFLSDTRNFNVGLLLATQFPDQLDDGVRKEVINNTSIKMCGPAAYAVVAQVNRDMRCDADFILSMKKRDYEYAEWACYVDNLTPSAVKLTVPFGAIEKLPMVPKRQVPPRSKSATTKRTVNAAEPGTTSPPQPEQPDPSPAPDDLDKDRWS